MPYKAKVPCGQAGCGELIKPGSKYCEKHLPLHPEVIRSAAGRGYGSRWQKESRRFLQANPLCRECQKEGRYVKATVVDHIIPHRGDMTLFWDPANWQPLCKKHHDQKTGREDSNPVYHY